MPHKVEASLLNIFRLFIGLRIILTIVSAIRYLPWFGPDLLWMAGISMGINLLLMLYLYSAPMQQFLPRMYLPIALIVVTCAIITEGRSAQWMALHNDFVANLPADLAEHIPPIIKNTAFPLFFTVGSTTLLFVPLVLISWQYNFRAVLLYIVLTTALETAFMVLMQESDPARIAVETFGIVSRNGAFLIVGYIVSQLATTQRKQQTSLQQSNRQLAAFATTREQLLVSQERNRLARELHDTLAHTMSAVTVKLNAVELLWDKDASRAKIMLNEVIAAMNDGMAETRRALRDLRASPLEDMGLVLAIRHLAETAAQRGGFTLDLQTPITELHYAPDIEQGVYRIVQETLTNAVEHANAKNVELTMRQEANRLILKIQDDGTGFDVNSAAQNGHFGLKGMYERAAMINGDLKIESSVEQGTVVVLEVFS